MIPPLQPPDSFYARAAEGWVELGNHFEANEELEKVSLQNRAHPDVLKVRCLIFSATQQWEAVCDISGTLTKLAPEEPLGWLEGSEALHRLNRTAEARLALLQVVDKFPNNAAMLYNLARYEAQLGTLQAAGDHLTEAFKLSSAPDIKLKAWEDPDLKPLWREHGITWTGNVLARPVDLAARPKPSRKVSFLMALLFWACAAAGMAWKAEAKTLPEFGDAALSAAEVLLGMGLFLFLYLGVGTIPTLIKCKQLDPDDPLRPILRFTCFLLLAGVIGVVLSLCCRL